MSTKKINEEIDQLNRRRETLHSYIATSSNPVCKSDYFRQLSECNNKIAALQSKLRKAN